MNEISEDKNALVRKSPQIPADLGRFREWADRECGAWPASLQLLAYDVVMGKRSIQEFKDAFYGFDNYALGYRVS